MLIKRIEEGVSASPYRTVATPSYPLYKNTKKDETTRALYRKYDWHILLFLDYSCDYLNAVLDAMDKLKCGSRSYDIAYDNLSSCSINTGLTFSDYISRTSVIVISITNSEKEFLKSYHHELGHCAVHICQFYGIPLEGEEVQYLGQDLVDRTWDIAKIFLCDCDCCKNKRNEKKRDFEGNESHEK